MYSNIIWSGYKDTWKYFFLSVQLLFCLSIDFPEAHFCRLLLKHAALPLALERTSNQPKYTMQNIKCYNLITYVVSESNCYKDHAFQKFTEFILWGLGQCFSLFKTVGIKLQFNSYQVLVLKYSKVEMNCADENMHIQMFSESMK